MSAKIDAEPDWRGFPIMKRLTLAQASTIVDVALKHCRDHNMKPMAIAVLDAGGHMLALSARRSREFCDERSRKPRRGVC